MNVPHFQLQASTSNRKGFFPFGLEATRNATDVSQMGEIQQRVDLAKDANRALDYYEAITSQAVIADNYPDDMNSRIGVVCRSFLMGKKDYSDSGYDVCAEFNPKGFDFPILKAQIRLRENQRELLLLSQESSGKLSLSMVDPYSANIISICQEADQALVVTSKKSNEVA